MTLLDEQGEALDLSDFPTDLAEQTTLFFGYGYAYLAHQGGSGVLTNPRTFEAYALG